MDEGNEIRRTRGWEVNWIWLSQIQGVEVSPGVMGWIRKSCSPRKMHGWCFFTKTKAKELCKSIQNGTGNQNLGDRRRFRSSTSGDRRWGRTELRMRLWKFDVVRSGLAKKGLKRYSTERNAALLLQLPFRAVALEKHRISRGKKHLLGTHAIFSRGTTALFSEFWRGAREGTYGQWTISKNPRLSDDGRSKSLLRISLARKIP